MAVYNVRPVKRVPLGTMTLAAVVVFHVQLAAAPAVTTDVPVPGGTAALAQALGIDPVPDRARFVSEIARLAYDAEARSLGVVGFLQTLRDPAARAVRAATSAAEDDLVPVPLTPALWGSAVFHRRVAPEDLILAIVADRSAALLCHGLTALDDDTLAYLAEHQGVLTRLYERSPAPFAAFSDSVQIAGGRVEPPGGADAVPLWEAVLHEKVTRPDRFLTALFETAEGRLAYLYDVAGRLDPARRAFLLGTWMTSPSVRLERFKALADAALTSNGDWRVRSSPFGRTSWDLAMTLAGVEVTDTGAPAPPAARTLWAQVFAGSSVSDPPAAVAPGDPPFDAAWLVSEIGVVDVRQRAERFDQLMLAQRAFREATPDQAADVIVALRAVPHYRMLMLTLDRLGIRAPAVYAAAARHAHRLGMYDGTRAFVGQAQFQGALAVVARLTLVRSIDAGRAAALVAQLAALPLREDGRYAGAVARWLRDDLLRGRPADPEAALIVALSGPASAESTAVRLTWEGERYRLDLGFAERHRLVRVREKQGGVPLGVPLELAAIEDSLQSGATATADLPAIAARLTAIAGSVPRRVREEGGWLPPGVGVGIDAPDTLRRAADELTRLARSRDAKRESRVAEALADVADEWLAHVLLSFVYAMHVGDPEGTVLLAGDVSSRHDFGFGSKDEAVRVRIAWSLPKQEVTPAAPWHVAGSLLGLDVALAPLALRRLNFDHLMGAPKLTSNDRDAFAAGISLMDPYALRDADRDAIADAADRGRDRVAAAITDPSAFDRLADDLGFDGRRRRVLRWTIAHDSGRVASMFTLAEMVAAGRPAASLDAWGTFALPIAGCLCTRMMPPGQRWLVVGRPQLGATGASIADLNLHVAIRLKELQLPAALARTVLSAAVQDLLDEVRPTDNSDWLTIARAATAATREQIEDYLAAATADGPLVPDAARSTP